MIAQRKEMVSDVPPNCAIDARTPVYASYVHRSNSNVSLTGFFPLTLPLIDPLHNTIVGAPLVMVTRWRCFRYVRHFHALANVQSSRSCCSGNNVLFRFAVASIPLSAAGHGCSCAGPIGAKGIHAVRVAWAAHVSCLFRAELVGGTAPVWSEAAGIRAWCGKTSLGENLLEKRPKGGNAGCRHTNTRLNGRPDCNISGFICNED